MYSSDTAGFIRLIIVIIVAFLLLVFSGIDIPKLPDQLDPDRLKSVSMEVIDRGMNLYETYIAGRIDSLIIKPSKNLLSLVNEYVIKSMKQVLRTVVLETPPIISK